MDISAGLGKYISKKGLSFKSLVIKSLVDYLNSYTFVKVTASLVQSYKITIS